MARRKKRWGLSMRKIREILRLGLQKGKCLREISRSCSIAHKTAGKYLRRTKELSLSYEQIIQMDDAEIKRLIVKECGSEKVRSRPEPDWEYIHGEMKKKGVTRQLLWQEYKEVYSDGYQSTQFCDLYARWKRKLKISLRQTHKAGEKTFVDYAGQTVPVINRHTGEVREAQIFVAVLGASNYTYAEATWDQRLKSWIGSHVRSYEYFGGVSRITVPDNLKSGVSKTCRYEPDINPTYHEMAVHYGTVIVPARANKPKDKAKVEVGVLIVERWILAALRNRTFFSLGDLNAAIRELLEILNNKPFKKLEGTRKSCFETTENKELLPLPINRYEYAEWKKVKSGIDYHVDVDGHYYSVPYQMRHKYFEARYTEKVVEIFYGNERIASHLRSYVKGHHTTVKEHMPKSHQEYAEWSPSRLIKWAQKTGKHTAELIETIISVREHPLQAYRSSLGILRLGKSYSSERMELACKRALIIKGYSYKSVNSILRNGIDKQRLRRNVPEAIIKHNNIRGREYFFKTKNKEVTQC